MEAFQLTATFSGLIRIIEKYLNKIASEVTLNAA